VARRPGSPRRSARGLRPVWVALLAVLTAACGGLAAGRTSGSAPTTASATTTPSGPRSTSPRAASAPVVRARTLAGRTVVLDPGHQVGNGRHPAQAARTVDAGNGVRKPCNTTGTRTNDGYPESRLTMRVALAAKSRLEAQGARVVLTRPREDRDRWGPCIDERGRYGNAVRADAVVSIHADGAPAGARGFHVIRPASVRGWTDDVAAPSRRLAVAVHDALRSAGVRPARYVGSRDGYDVRSDLGTLNWSDRPVVMVELGNMRDALDAALLTDPSWQDGVAAAALTAGVVDYLGR